MAYSAARRADALELARTLGVHEASKKTGISVRSIYNWRGPVRKSRAEMARAIRLVVRVLWAPDANRSQLLDELERLLAARDLL